MLRVCQIRYVTGYKNASNTLKKVVRKHEIWYTLIWIIINYRFIYFIILTTKRNGNKNKEIYKVKTITEADLGCEETGRKEPMALL